MHEHLTDAELADALQCHCKVADTIRDEMRRRGLSVSGTPQREPAPGLQSRILRARRGR